MAKFCKKSRWLVTRQSSEVTLSAGKRCFEKSFIINTRVDFSNSFLYWDKCLPLWPSPIGPTFYCMFDPQNWQIWSDLGCNSAWPSLAPGSVSYSIQAQLHQEQLPEWPCTRVPDRAMPLREWHSSKAQPSVVVPGSAPGPSISEGTIREKRFLRLLITAVELTSCWLLHNEHQLFRKRLKTHYMQQSTEDRCQQCDLYYYYYYYYY